MAAYVFPNKVRFKEIPAGGTALTWETAVTNGGIAETAVAPTNSITFASMTLPFSIDSTGPSWRRLTITAGGNTYTFWQADIFPVQAWALANSTPTPQAAPF